MYNKNEENTEFSIPDSVLSDLCSRFIINVPEEDRNDLIRVFFQIEIAHWFYLDFYCDDSTYSSSSSGNSSGSNSSSQSSSSSGGSSSSSASSDSESEEAPNVIARKSHPHPLKPCSIRHFAAQIFRYCPYLMQHSHNVDDILSNWRLFKHAVPTNGAIILDPSRKNVLLVQGFWAKASWGFPKGKVNEHESEASCARREVLEETGFDIEPSMRPDDYLEIQMQEQVIRLYIIDGVSMKTKFEPKTRKEIKEVRWFPIDDLPVHRKDHRTKHRLGYSPNSFFMVIPFVKSLKQWIAIQNGTLTSAQLVNGYIVHTKTPNNSNIIMPNKNKSSNKKHQQMMQNNNRQGGNNNNSNGKRRRNSHSHSGGGNMSLQHHHHHHHHHQNNSYNNNNNNNSQSLNHYQTDSPNRYNQQQQTYKILSRSNENLANNNKPNTPVKQQQQKKTPQTNVFLKHFSNGFSKNLIEDIDVPATTTVTNVTTAPMDEAMRSQNQYYERIQQTELADILSLKESYANVNTFKARTLQPNAGGSQHQLGHNSKFKPVQSFNGLSANKTKSQQQQQQSNQQQQQRRPVSTTCKELQFSPLSKNTNTNSLQMSKKQLDFSGPECWINFKFDYDAISQNLPPALSLLQL